MSRIIFATLFLMAPATWAFAQDEVAEVDDQLTSAAADDGEAESSTTRREEEGTVPDQPREMSGMSILGNEEAPKALVIVPWKSSELGDDIAIAADLGDEAKPVDKEVFVRELRFYQIRKGE